MPNMTPIMTSRPVKMLSTRVRDARACRSTAGPPSDPAEKEDGVVRDLGVLRQKDRQGRIRRQVVGLRQQGRVEAQHLGDRRRVLLEDLVQPIVGVARVCSSAPGPAPGPLGLPAVGAAAFAWAAAPAGSHGQQQPRQKRHSCRHYPLYTQAPAGS